MPRPKVGAPPPPPPKAKPKATKWCEKHKAEQRLQRLLSFQIVNRWRDDAVSAPLSSKLDWSTIDSVVYLDGGSHGVLLARFHSELPEPPRLCCLKPQRMEAQAELCASILADALQVRTAPLEVVPLSSDISQALRDARLARDGHREYVDRLLAESKYLGIVEFVNGPTMEQEEFVKIFDEGSGKLARFWTEAGVLTAFDCLINNLDRLPIIWNNSGNLKNLMVEVGCAAGPRVVGIDQAVRGISDSTGLERYIEQLQSLLKVVLGSETDWLKSDCLQRVQAAVQANFQDKFRVHALAMKEGLQKAFRCFAWRWCSGALQRSLDEAMNKVMATFGCSDEQLRPLRNMVEKTAKTVADEVQKIQLHHMPDPIVQIFRKCIPSGQIARDEMLRLLQHLEPRLEMNAIQLFLDSFSNSEAVDCSEFLLLIWEGPQLAK